MADPSSEVEPGTAVQKDSDKMDVDTGANTSDDVVKSKPSTTADQSPASAESSLPNTSVKSELAEKTPTSPSANSQSSAKPESLRTGASREPSEASVNDKRKSLEKAAGETPSKKPKAGKSLDEMSPLERAQEAAVKARIHLLPELDPEEPPAVGTGLPRHQHKYSLSAIRAIKRLKDASPFVAPVDPVALGVPHYFDYIKQPMDLGTIERKLVENQYDTVQEIVKDFNLVVSNCIVFNGENAVISKMALNIAQSFKKQLSNMPTFDATRKGSQAAAAQAAQTQAPATTPTPHPVAPTVTTAASPDDGAILDENVPKRASTAMTVLGPNGVPTLRRKSTIDGRPKREVRPPRHTQGSYVGSGTGEGRPRNKKFAAELRFSGQVLREMQSRKLEAIAWPFLAPVDPVEMGAPNYFDIIKEPMDLGTISKKLSEGIYYNAEEFESDVRLMFHNCYTFNPEGTHVNVLGHKLEEHFNQRWLDKPIPGMHTEDSDMSDVDEEYAESGIVNAAIQVLEDQRRMIRKQIKRLKKDALAEFYRRGQRKGHNAAAVQAKRRRLSNATAAPPSSTSSQRAMPTEMTYEMKRELRDKIDKLPEKKINTVIAIIQESMPDLGNNGQDEIELEVDAMDTQTLLRLYSYAVLGRREPVKPAPSANGANGHGTGAGSPGYGTDLDVNTSKRRSKALSEEEHERKIAEIESKLKEFEHASNPSPTSTSGGLLGTSANKAASESTPGLAAGSVGPESDSSGDEGQPFDSDSSSEEE